MLKCGYLAYGHRHNDDGHILLYGLGEDWLIDSGMYGYKYDQIRDYITSPSAHNLSFPYETKGSPPSDKKRINSLNTRLKKYENNWGIIEADNNHVICESHIFKGYTYKRKLDIIGDQFGILLISISYQMVSKVLNQRKQFQSFLKAVTISIEISGMNPERILPLTSF